MDIPEANCVIRFDAITTPVSLVQSRSRARQADSAFVVLAEVKGRSVETLETPELAQHTAITAVNNTVVDTAAHSYYTIRFTVSICSWCKR